MNDTSDPTKTYDQYQAQLADDINHLRMLISLTADHYTKEDLIKANEFLDRMEFVANIQVQKLNRQQRRSIKK